MTNAQILIRRTGSLFLEALVFLALFVASDEYIHQVMAFDYLAFVHHAFGDVISTLSSILNTLHQGIHSLVASVINFYLRVAEFVKNNYKLVIATAIFVQGANMYLFMRWRKRKPIKRGEKSESGHTWRNYLSNLSFWLRRRPA